MGLGELEELLALPKRVIGINANGRDFRHETPFPWSGLLRAYTKMASARQQTSLDVTIKIDFNSYVEKKYDHRLPNRAGSLHLLGGNLALDFANTESGRGGAQHLNHIQSAADVVTWARHADVINDTTATQARLMDRHEQDELFVEGKALRQAIYEINSTLAAGKSPQSEATQTLGRAHGKTLQSATLAPRGGKYSWTWGPDAKLVDVVLGPIAQAAVALLTQSDHKRIKQCQGKHCGWLFCDSSKNNSRRWCDMSVCGNRSKIRALRKRRESNNAGNHPSGQRT